MRLWLDVGPLLPQEILLPFCFCCLLPVKEKTSPTFLSPSHQFSPSFTLFQYLKDPTQLFADHRQPSRTISFRQFFGFFALIPPRNICPLSPLSPFRSIITSKIPILLTSLDPFRGSLTRTSRQDGGPGGVGPPGATQTV